MKVDSRNLEIAEKLLKELRTLENASAILGTRAYTVTANIKANNPSILCHPYKESVNVPLPKDVTKAIQLTIENRIFEIQKELSEL